MIDTEIKTKIKNIYNFYKANQRYVNFFLVCFVCAFSMMLIDKPLARYFKSKPEIEALFGSITKIAKVYVWIAVSLGAWGFCMVMAGLSLSSDKFEKYSRLARSFLFMLMSILSSGFVILILKITVGRARPTLLFSDEIYGVSFFNIKDEYMSFPSGHSQAICAAMASLFFIYPRYDFLYIFIALILTLSRVFTTNHYLSDIVMGSYIAVITTVAVKNYFEKNGESVRIYLDRDKDLIK
ncbi:MAG: PAP2 superfamily protein [Alphaproteobacteria bacterium ADurb.Bin438]|nr:MAG: PAP2 superfamily protein [Alphaproteobacteria bacterium ADurb.Bin438]